MSNLHEKVKFQTGVKKFLFTRKIADVKFQFGLKDGRENTAVWAFTSVSTCKRLQSFLKTPKSTHAGVKIDV